jgi:WD40 repeat protein
VLTGSWDITAKLWNVSTGAVIRTFSGHDLYLSSVAFSRDGTKVLTGSGDHTAKVWNLATGALMFTTVGQADAVTSVAFSPNANRVLSGSADGTTRLETIPMAGTIVINGNRSATNTTAVTLALDWWGGEGTGVVRMRFSNDGSHWSAWESLAKTKTYTLPSGDGHKTVRVQFLDKLNNSSAVFSDYILLDTTPPTGTIIINGGAANTTSRSVTLGLTWSDGTGSQVSRVRFSDDGAHWTAWEVPKATRAYTLPAGLGYHTVRAQYLDGANNYSAAYNDYIKLVAP